MLSNGLAPPGSWPSPIVRISQFHQKASTLKAASCSNIPGCSPRSYCKPFVLKGGVGGIDSRTEFQLKIKYFKDFTGSVGPTNISL